ncbi:Hypothetical predicted protein [Podarcis lilfordi]|uniref:Uncharacterized protein n=1 Tax=Podarcis lilfordi TaxID=74358 RepID=A0AA35NXQ4_9SAUR|nr:Hypothetical predicted protein [Podarcis lilfordi]
MAQLKATRSSPHLEPGQAQAPDSAQLVLVAGEPVQTGALQNQAPDLVQMPPEAKDLVRTETPLVLSPSPSPRPSQGGTSTARSIHKMKCRVCACTRRNFELLRMHKQRNPEVTNSGTSRFATVHNMKFCYPKATYLEV